MASLAFFPLYPKDFLGATGRLTAEKFGIYTRLLFASWIEPLKNDQKELKILSGATHKKTMEILERFFVLKDGIWINERLERERVKAVKKHAVRVEKATKAAEARWNATSNAPSNATSNAQAYPQAMPTQNSHSLSKDKESFSDDFQRLIDGSGIIFTSMTVPNLLNTLFNKHGLTAVEKMLEILQTKSVSQQNSGSYVRTVINNTDFSIKPKTKREPRTAEEAGYVRLPNV